MQETNTTVLSHRGFFLALKHLSYQMKMETNSGLKIPASLRGIPHTTDRVKHDPPPAGFFPDQAAELVEIRKGTAEAGGTWRHVLQYPIDENPRNGFFTKPWKHFDLAAEMRQKHRQ